MTVHFNGYTPPEPPKPSLAQRLGVSGRIEFLKQGSFWVLAEDDEPEPVTVRLVYS